MPRVYRPAVMVAGNSLVPSRKALTRTCPECGAGPGRWCFRMVGRNKAEGFPGYQVRLAQLHKGR